MNFNIVIRVGLLGGLSLLSGCLDMRPGNHPRSTLPVPPATLAQIDYAKSRQLICSESNLLATPHYAVRRVTMPAAANIAWTNRTVALDCYMPKAKERVPVILILPI